MIPVEVFGQPPQFEKIEQAVLVFLVAERNLTKVDFLFIRHSNAPFNLLMYAQM